MPSKSRSISASTALAELLLHGEQRSSSLRGGAVSASTFCLVLLCLAQPGNRQAGIRRVGTVGSRLDSEDEMSS